MRILRSAAYQAVPWKNGQGTTREILKHPDGAADFIYRLSIAEVTQSGPFSAFPGTDRIIMLLDGGGFDLTFADGRTHALTSRHAPFCFDGGVSATCTVAGGPSQDLNLMVRRGAAKADADVYRVEGRLILPPVPGATRLMVALADGLTVRRGGQTVALRRWDTACIEATDAPADQILCESAGIAELFYAAVTPNAGPDESRSDSP
jgi:environmental stress-induced protein Ves